MKKTAQWLRQWRMGAAGLLWGLILAQAALGAGHFSLAFQRKQSAWENAAGPGCPGTALGGRACRVWIWDENGNPVANVKLYTTWGVHMGTTDAAGRCQISFNTGIGFDLVCIGQGGIAGASSDAARLMTGELDPCRPMHSWEVGYLYKADVKNPGKFDTDLHGDWPAMHSYTTQAPYTKSLAFSGVDYRDYWSDASHWSDNPTPPYFGQTFVATGDRVVAARVHGTIGGVSLLSWKLQVLEFPSMQPVGRATEVPVEWPFGWEAFWGVNDNPVVPGRTYFLKVWRDGGMNIYHVTRDVYPHGVYYEGTTPVPQFDLNGHIVCMSVNQYGPSIGLVGWWRLDESAGIVAADASGNVHHGLLYGPPSWLPGGGRLGGALRFGGTADHVQMFDFRGIPWIQSRTVGAWIRTDADKTADIVGWGAAGVGESWRLFVDGATGAFGVSVTGGQVIGRTDVTDGRWHHVAVAVGMDDDPDIADARLYVDGRPEAPGSLVPGRFDTVLADPLRIGVFNTASTRYFAGDIDDVALFDVALTDEQMTRLCSFGPASFDAPCGRLGQSPAVGRGGDLNRDCAVDGGDFALLAEYWLTTGLFAAGDLSGDGSIDARDLEVLAGNWASRIDPNLYGDLLVYYRLDEAAGATAHDTIAANDGVVHGDAVWAPTGGKVRGALRFDGVDDYVATGFVLNPNEGGFSAFAWVRGGEPSESILAQANGAGTGKVWLYANYGDGRPATALSDGNRTTRPLAGPTSVTDGQWHHVGVVWDGSRRVLYHNGVQVAADTTPLGPIESADGGLYLGADKTLGAATLFSGWIDDVQVYGRPLTADEAAFLAQ